MKVHRAVSMMKENVESVMPHNSDSAPTQVMQKKISLQEVAIRSLDGLWFIIYLIALLVLSLHVIHCDSEEGTRFY